MFPWVGDVFYSDVADTWEKLESKKLALLCAGCGGCFHSPHICICVDNGAENNSKTPNNKTREKGCIRVKRTLEATTGCKTYPPKYAKG